MVVLARFTGNAGASDDSVIGNISRIDVSGEFAKSDGFS
jgi:hypothetical protein